MEPDYQVSIHIDISGPPESYSRTSMEVILALLDRVCDKHGADDDRIRIGEVLIEEIIHGHPRRVPVGTLVPVAHDAASSFDPIPPADRDPDDDDDAPATAPGGATCTHPPSYDPSANTFGNVTDPF